VKEEVKGQKAEGKNKKSLSLFLPFAYQLLPFDLFSFRLLP
jgi:hypothetical protein